MGALAGICLALLAHVPAWAQPQTASNMPSWTVLALKLVSATHVQPTTGIVIAAPDIVLVAADFARKGDEIMVLDGGTDIVRHGRPATIIHTLPADRLAILRVQGLNRQAARLSAVNLADIHSLDLVAFPPAEDIAQGAEPVRATVKTLAAITTSYPTLEPFPNVSAALTDACGNLVAFNLASGVQSMQPVNSPRLVWTEGLQRAAGLAGTSLQSATCDPVQAANEVPKEPETAESVEQAGTPPAADPLEAPEPEAVAEPATEDSQPEVEAEPGLPDGGDENAPGEHESGELEPESVDEPASDSTAADASSSETGGVSMPNTGTPRWLTLAGLIGGALVLMLLGWRLMRQRSRSAQDQTPVATTNTTTSNEPATVRFEAAAQPSQVVLKISGERSHGEQFDLSLPVDGPDWAAELGRQDADVDLESATVSRRHARLELHEGRITLTDLDSTNGTRLNGMTCLPGEVFFVQADDQLKLGEVSLKLQLTVDEVPAA